MVIRHRGHSPNCLLVDNGGEVVRRLKLNASPNETGMEAVYWNGRDKAALLANGGMLWDLADGTSTALPGLPPPTGPQRQGWYHALPADLAGDEREDLLLYNPWAGEIFVYTPAPHDPTTYGGYRPGPRQVNPRLMD
jgi:hypothetical protein